MQPWEQPTGRDSPVRPETPSVRVGRWPATRSPTYPEVELTHLKTDQTFEGSVTLTEAQGEVSTIFGGTGKLHEPEAEPLSAIIQKLNERFGTDFAPEDRVFYDVVFDKLTKRPDIQQAAAANTAENFKLVLEKEAMAGVLDQLGVSEEMALAYVDDPDMQAEILTWPRSCLSRSARL